VVQLGGRYGRGSSEKTRSLAASQRPNPKPGDKEAGDDVEGGDVAGDHSPAEDRDGGRGGDNVGT
jgi:hypothetical protein